MDTDIPLLSEADVQSLVQSDQQQQPLDIMDIIGSAPDQKNDPSSAGGVSEDVVSTVDEGSRTRAMPSPMDRNPCSQMMYNGLYEIRQNNVLCDVVLLASVDNPNNIQINAHSAVLAAGSTFFYNVFVNLESSIFGQVFQITDVKADELGVCVDFLYGVAPVGQKNIDLLKHGAEILSIESAENYIKDLSKVRKANVGTMTDQTNRDPTVRPTIKLAKNDIVGNGPLPKSDSKNSDQNRKENGKENDKENDKEDDDENVHNNGEIVAQKTVNMVAPGHSEKAAVDISDTYRNLNTPRDWEPSTKATDDVSVNSSSNVDDAENLTGDLSLIEVKSEASSLCDDDVVDNSFVAYSDSEILASQIDIKSESDAADQYARIEVDMPVVMNDDELVEPNTATKKKPRRYCKVCGQHFFSNIPVEKHLFEVHHIRTRYTPVEPDDMGHYKCELCDKVNKSMFPYSRHLVKHRKTEYGKIVRTDLLAHVDFEPVKSTIKPTENNTLNENLTADIDESVVGKSNSTIKNKSNSEASPLTDDDEVADNECVAYNDDESPGGEIEKPNTASKKKPRRYCKVCGQHFFSNIPVEKHLFEVHHIRTRYTPVEPDDMGRYKCTLCGKVNMILRNYLQHLKKHRKTEYGKIVRADLLAHVDLKPVKSTIKPTEKRTLNENLTADIDESVVGKSNSTIKNKSNSEASPLTDDDEVADNECVAYNDDESPGGEIEKPNTASMKKPRRYCKVCGQHFFSNIPVEKHLFEVHHIRTRYTPVEPDDMGHYKCELCDKVYAAPCEYSYHLKNHRKAEVRTIVRSDLLAHVDFVPPESTIKPTEKRMLNQNATSMSAVEIDDPAMKMNTSTNSVSGKIDETIDSTENIPKSLNLLKNLNVVHKDANKNEDTTAENIIGEDQLIYIDNPEKNEEEMNMDSTQENDDDSIGNKEEHEIYLTTEGNNSVRQSINTDCVVMLERLQSNTDLDKKDKEMKEDCCEKKMKGKKDSRKKKSKHKDLETDGEKKDSCQKKIKKKKHSGKKKNKHKDHKKNEQKSDVHVVEDNDKMETIGQDDMEQSKTRGKKRPAEDLKESRSERKKARREMKRLKRTQKFMRKMEKKKRLREKKKKKQKEKECYKCVIYKPQKKSLSLDTNLKFAVHLYMDHSFYWCSICSRVYKLKFSCLIHVASHGIKANYQQLRALKIIISRSNIQEVKLLQETMDLKSTGQPAPNIDAWCKTQFHCFYCDRQYDSSQELIEHIQEHLKNDMSIEDLKRYTYDCHRCDESFTRFIEIRAHKLEKHPKIQSDELKYPCHLCRMRFQTDEQRQAHLDTFAHVHAVKCDICDEVVRSVTQLLIHQQLNHSDREKSVMCEQCGKCFLHEVYLKRHLNTVHAATRSKNYLCTLCPCKFYTQGDLTKHKNYVHAVRDQPLPFLCTVCGAMFSQHAPLKKHQAKHVEETCDQCGYHCNYTPNMKRHMRMEHPTTKKKKAKPPYVCSICGRVYKVHCYLLFHMRNHQEKKYACNICDYKAVSKYILKVHQDKHSETRSHTCHICHNSYKRRSALTVHLKKHAKGTIGIRPQVVRELEGSVKNRGPVNWAVYDGRGKPKEKRKEQTIENQTFDEYTEVEYAVDNIVDNIEYAQEEEFDYEECVEILVS